MGDKVSSMAGERPLVSVLVPTRGRPVLVREAIAAITGQTYPGPIECIVVHDQEPPDPALAQLGADRRSVTAVANTHTPGLAGSRNTGLDLARGGFIATCDDDDIWYPDKLEIQVARLLREPDLLAVGCGMRLLLPGNKVVVWPGRAERISYSLLLRNRVKELRPSTLVMRREAYDLAGTYDEKLPRSHAEDYDWLLRAARAGALGTVQQVLADIQKGQQTSRERWDGGGERNVAGALEYLLAKHPDLTKSRRGHARLLGQIAFARSLLGERRVALRYALRAAARWPASAHAYVALAHIVTGMNRRQFLRAARVLRRGLA